MALTNSSHRETVAASFCFPALVSLETGAAAGFGNLPLGRDERLEFQALESWIERARFNEQGLMRGWRMNWAMP